MSTPKPAPKPEWAPFAAEIKRLRTERGLQKQQLAVLVGAAPSWITGVEAGTIAPSQRRVAALALALGVPMVSLPVPWERMAENSESAEVLDPEVLLPLIWRARCDLLRGLAQSTSRKQPERRHRLQQLASYVDRAAAEHPTAAAFSANESLWPLHALAKQAPAWARAVALAEVACMKIDAPFETGAHRDKMRLTHLDFIAHDLGFGAEVGESVGRSVLAAHAKLTLPLWQDLPPIGGSRGVLALRSLAGDNEALEVLVGSDPVGWLGSAYAAGRWLIDGADDGAEPVSAPITGVDQAWGPAASVGAAAGTAMALGAVLGPVVGAAAGALVGGAAGLRAARRAELRVDAMLAGMAEASPQIRRIAVIAESFGRHWVTVEACKLLALYEAMRYVDEPAPLPSAQLAAAHCYAIAETVRGSVTAEEEASGTTSGTANERLKELRQIQETLRWTGETLRGRRQQTSTEASPRARRARPKRDAD